VVLLFFITERWKIYWVKMAIWLSGQSINKYLLEWMTSSLC
jgi:hypothetical protein